MQQRPDGPPEHTGPGGDAPGAPGTGTDGRGTGTDGTGMSHRTAVALVAGSSAAVLVVEIVALRLLAPYLGLTLETSTIVIGLALAAIALGSWAGGRAADAGDPRRLLGPALGISGAAVAATPSVLRVVAEGAPGLLLPVAALMVLVPGALLSAVTPIATKLRLSTLERTGTVVGQLSGIGTVGAIAGTVLTGFVLVSRIPVTAILLGLGVLLVLAALPFAWSARRHPGALATVGVLAAGGLALPWLPGGCDVETAYHCALLEEDPEREGGRLLVLDGLRHSYVDVDDPEHLEFAYVRAAAAAIDATYAGDDPLDAYFLGGGGLTLPRWLAETRPGTSSTVSEIDPGVVQIDREELPLPENADVDVRVEDARLGLGRMATDSVDLVVGDAFGGVSVPWHLTTEEALAEVDRALRPGGTYVVNLIDHGEMAFVRAEVRTLQQVFEHVVALGEPGTGARRVSGSSDTRSLDQGNVVVVASDSAVDLDAVAAGLEQRDTGWVTLAGDALAEWVGDAMVLTDDHAPVDQLLTPYATG
ncbi:MAG: fused MFS/spermidine synthase [Nocardioides sp.]